MVPLARPCAYSEPMCGRFTLAGNLDQVAARFEAEVTNKGIWEWEPRYNVAPGTVIPVVAFNGQRERTVVPMRWGLHPSWRKETPEGRPLFNARVETAAEKPSFRTPFKRRRALIPTTGWYEWERIEMLSAFILHYPNHGGEGGCEAPPSPYACALARSQMG